MLQSLWNRTQKRHFALLDNQGRCLGLWQLCEAPRGLAWVEVNACDPRWIGKPLPASACVSSNSPPVRLVQRAPAASSAAM